MTVPGATLTVGSEPTADDDRQGNDGDHKYGLRPCCEAGPLYIDQGKSAGILTDCVGLGFQLHLLCNLLPVEPVEASELTEFNGFITESTHDYFFFKRSERLGTGSAAE